MLVSWDLMVYPLVICHIAIENGQFIWDLPIKLVMFYFYVSVPEGSRLNDDQTQYYNDDDNGMVNHDYIMMNYC